jgi:hypothetical protein
MNINVRCHCGRSGVDVATEKLRETRARDTSQAPFIVVVGGGDVVDVGAQRKKERK